MDDIQQEIAKNACHSKRLNLLVSYDTNGPTQYVGISLIKNIFNRKSNNNWKKILEKSYGCVNVHKKFHVDGATAYNIFLLNQKYNKFPFYVKWITTEQYTSNNFRICRDNNKRSKSVRQIIVNNKSPITNDETCKFFLSCNKCNVVFKSDEVIDKCRWCSALKNNLI
jgi:hypothetical protein